MMLRLANDLARSQDCGARCCGFSIPCENTARTHQQGLPRIRILTVLTPLEFSLAGTSLLPQRGHQTSQTMTLPRPWLVRPIMSFQPPVLPGLNIGPTRGHQEQQRRTSIEHHAPILNTISVLSGQFLATPRSPLDARG